MRHGGRATPHRAPDTPPMTTRRAAAALLRARGAGGGWCGGGAPAAAAGAPPLAPQAPPRNGRGLHTTRAAAAAGPAPSPLDGPFALTLERAVGERAGVDAELAASGLFGAEVFPDLPIATTWDGLYRAMLK
jgi:hypothetical protein